MKIITKVGNLMNVTEGFIVHGCNAQGIMGSGVALAVKRKFPGAYDFYMEHHNATGLKLGAIYPYVQNDKLVIVNAITQEGFGNTFRNTSYDAVVDAFQCLESVMLGSGWAFNIPKQIHIPLIGAARGGGNWEIIREIIEQTVTYPVRLWLPDDTVDTK